MKFKDHYNKLENEVKERKALRIKMKQERQQ
jgi:sortase (surface protein transpeptidase)